MDYDYDFVDWMHDLIEDGYLMYDMFEEGDL